MTERICQEGYFKRLFIEGGIKIKMTVRSTAILPFQNLLTVWDTETARYPYCYFLYSGLSSIKLTPQKYPPGAVTKLSQPISNV